MRCCHPRLQNVLLQEFLDAGKCARAPGRARHGGGWGRRHHPSDLGLWSHRFHLLWPLQSSLDPVRETEKPPFSLLKGLVRNSIFCSWNFLNKILRAARKSSGDVGQVDLLRNKPKSFASIPPACCGSPCSASAVWGSSGAVPSAQGGPVGAVLVQE